MLSFVKVTKERLALVSDEFQEPKRTVQFKCGKIFRHLGLVCRSKCEAKSVCLCFSSSSSSSSSSLTLNALHQCLSLFVLDVLLGVRHNKSMFTLY
ncbi:hypothetical protein Bca101_082153 [Brassica carinata]